jgi:histidine ammonia-lyase
LAVRRAAEQLGHLRQALACEMMIAAQALDLRRPARLPAAVEALHGFVRRHVAFLDDDRSTTEDIELLSAALHHGEALAAVRGA